MPKYVQYSVCIMFGFLLGLSISLIGKEKTHEHFTPYNYSTLVNVIESIEKYYVDIIPQGKLIEAAIEGIFTQLDPYSDLLNKEEVISLKESNTGQYFGYGFRIKDNNQGLKVITPIANSPAAKAGIKSGDTLKSLNGKQITKNTTEQILASIKQSRLHQQAIHLELVHQEQQAYTVNLKPDFIHVQSVQSHIIKENIGYIRLNNFQETATEEIQQVISHWKSHHHITSLILDLRDNPGGLLEQAVSIADLFLKKGLIVATKGRYLSANSRYYASANSIGDHLPILVMINQDSASSAEILAAALQENGRAKLMGIKTFGKGTVQSLIPSKIDDHAIKLTIAEYTTPRGNNIHLKGVNPDISFTLNQLITSEKKAGQDLINDPQLVSAVDWLKRNEPTFINM